MTKFDENWRMFVTNSAHEQIQQYFENSQYLIRQDWLNHFVFSGEWWLLFILTIVPWFLWWRLVDKSRILEISLYGLFISSISTFLDILGWNYSLWFYPHTLLGTCTPLIPIDYTLLSIMYMLLYQYFSKWKRFTIMLLMVSLFLAFVLEPFAEMIHFYKPLKWHHIYSAPGYILLGVFSKWLIIKLLETQRHKASSRS